MGPASLLSIVVMMSASLLSIVVMTSSSLLPIGLLGRGAAFAKRAPRMSRANWRMKISAN